MEVKNGIIIDGLLHEMASENVPCNQCSLLRICSKSEKEEYSICLCAFYELVNQYPLTTIFLAIFIYEVIGCVMSNLKKK